MSHEHEVSPSLYAVLHAAVRYDRDLYPAAKVLYAEITANQNSDGFCYSSNGYFARIYGVDQRTVQRWIEDLSLYIVVEYGRFEWYKAYARQPCFANRRISLREGSLTVAPEEFRTRLPHHLRESAKQRQAKRKRRKN